MSKTIFTITTVYINAAGVADSRCVGYEFSKQMAIDMVIGNYADIHEDLYSHCVIEETVAGLYPRIVSFLWFEWDKDAERYIHCCVPDACVSISNYGIG